MDQEHDSLLDFHDEPKRRKVYFVIGGIVLLLVLLGAAAAVIFTVDPFDFFYQPKELPPSNSGELLHLVRLDATRTNGDNPVVARSYDGNTWELMPDQDTVPPNLDCGAGKSVCVVRTKGKYRVSKIEVPEYIAKATEKERFARFLSQATFGPKKAEIELAMKDYMTDYAGWIYDQVNMAPTLHRTHYRQRTNQRQRASSDVGAIFKPCELSSRYHTYTFNFNDKGKTIVFSDTEIPGSITLRIDGALRTEVPPGIWISGMKTVTFPTNFTICYVEEKLSGWMMIANSTHPTLCNWQYGMLNPPIKFTTPNPEITKRIALEDADLTQIPGRPGSFILTRLSSSVTCPLGIATTYIAYNNSFYRFDPRLKLLENTLTNPTDANSEASLTCPSVTKTFVNAKNCLRRTSCAPFAFTSATITLDNATLRSWFTDSNRYVYLFTGLRLTDGYDKSPCSKDKTRWRRLGPGPCPNATVLPEDTRQTMIKALTSSDDKNPYIRDVTLGDKNCSTSYITIGAQVHTGTECFEHVHPDLLSIRDASYWVISHYGNADAIRANRPNPIANFAETGGVALQYPWHHQMNRWWENTRFMPYVGRWGDSMDFRALPTALQTLAMAKRVGAAPSRPSEGFEACGSPGEAANIPLLGHRYNMPGTSPNDAREAEIDWRHHYDAAKSMIWTNVALNAPDQLRQRVAWALAQIWTIGEFGIGRADEIEPWSHFYDIFVRHAFGNYRDIMREVSYHPMMSFYLSYYQNKAFSVSGAYPDENYAREIMQLFSIGLWKLNDDGTQTLDAEKNPITTYTNDDIQDFARLWTGFDTQQARSNVERVQGDLSLNVLDPLQIKPGWRDLLPKPKLDQGYLGDAYPICDYRPPQPFLKEGARFVLTGDSSIEGPTMDEENPARSGLRGRFAPTPGSSQLHNRLCAPDASGKCTFPTEVTLTSALPCDGKECDAGRVISVKVVDPVAKVSKYYTYVSVPCVRLTFFPEGKVTAAGDGASSRQCADPIAKVAMPVCCQPTAQTTVVENVTNCRFANEAMDFSVATQRCESLGLALCNVNFSRTPRWIRTCAEQQYMWLNAPCRLQIQVYPTGQVAVADPIVTNNALKVLRKSSNNVFRVRWAGGKYPRVSAGCGTCQNVTTSIGETCVCDLRVEESVVFTDPSTVPSRATIASSLFIGAAVPSSFGDGVYQKCTSAACAATSDVTVWVKSGQSTWDASTIFEITPSRAGGPKMFLANRRSTVYVDESYSFRNPPHFMPFTGEQVPNTEWSSDLQWLPRAEQEIEAGLDHLFEHPSTAPFVCYRMIQRMVTSNPSPRYMRSVVNAFRTGAYGGRIYSGRYGDLRATVTAILLDPEARSPVLEADPTFGSLREPILKILHLMRSMEFTPRDGMEVGLPELFDRIGMEPWKSRSVFGFYLPDHRPDGPVGEGGLVAPEAQLAVPPLIVGYLNGMTSLIDNGLTVCGSGFGFWMGRKCDNPKTISETNDGSLQYSPANESTPAEVVDELALLLTGGRLNPTLRAYIASRYQQLLNRTSRQSALKHVQKLMISAPEFHSSGGNVHKNETRTKRKEPPSGGRRYKAIVVIFLDGGCDSYNLLVPHSNCTQRDLAAEYAKARGQNALDPASVHRIPVPPGTQPCLTFGLHGSMPNLKQLYDDQDALFVANIGALVEPITKADWLRTSGRTRKWPPSLFAHDIMTRSTQNLHAQNKAAKGVLGRAVAALQAQATPYRSELFSLTGTQKILEGAQTPDVIHPWHGVKKFEQYRNFAEDFGNLTKNVTEQSMSETFARLLVSSLEKTEEIGQELKDTTIATNFPNNGFALQLNQVAKLIKMRTSMKTERAVFVTARGGYDTHGSFDMSSNFGEIDSALGAFAKEMKAQGVWDDVVVFTISEFGRTLDPNGAGTDHAWAGNQFLAGGAIKGGRIIGKYPESFLEEGSVRIGRGLLLPTTSWEAVWKGMVEWFGVEDGQLEDVLPNLPNFPKDDIFNKDDLFNS